MRFTTPEAQARIDAAKVAVETARTALDEAHAKFRRVRSDESKAAASSAIGRARSTWTLALNELRLAEQVALNEYDDEQLIRYYIGSANYLYEATMGDYSSGSISRGEDELKNAKVVLEARGMLHKAQAALDQNREEARQRAEARDAAYKAARAGR